MTYITRTSPKNSSKQVEQLSETLQLIVNILLIPRDEFPASRRRHEIKQILAPVRLRDRSHLVLTTAAHAHPRRPLRPVPTLLSFVEQHHLVQILLAPGPIRPRSQSCFRRARLGFLRRPIERAQLVDVLVVGVLEALALQGREFLVRTEVELKVLLEVRYFRLDVSDGFLGAEVLVAGFRGLVD